MSVAAPDVSARSLAQLVSLKGRRAVVTGAARGLGYAIARRLAEAGANVALGDRDETGASRAAATLERDFLRRAVSGPLDVADGTSVASFAELAVRGLGGIDIWVNNAGIYPATPLLEMTDDQWDLMSDVNLRGTFLGCREAARRMLSNGGGNGAGGPGGVIVNIASIAGFRGRAGLSHYAASKHGVIGLTQSAAVELGPRGIRVLAVAPSLAETPGVQEMRAAAVAAHRPAGTGTMLGTMERTLVESVPLGRAAQPDEIARVVLFAVSDLAGFMTGTTLFADGGLSAT